MLTAAFVFLLLLIALLAIPVTLTFQLSWQQGFRDDIRLQWAFGLVHMRVASFRSKTSFEKSEGPEQRTGRSDRSSRKNQNVFAAVRLKTFRRRIIKFIRDLWRAVHKRNVSLRVRIGVGDPADTGQLWAIVGPAAAILANIQEASITIEPEFFDPIFELDSSGSIRLIPLQVICLTVALMLSPPIWRGIRQMRAAGQ